jgi:hypothetical protein
MFGKYPRRTVVGEVAATGPEPALLAVVAAGLLSLPQAAPRIASVTTRELISKWR